MEDKGDAERMPKQREQQGQGRRKSPGFQYRKRLGKPGHTECGHGDRYLKRLMRGVFADPGKAFRIKLKSDMIGFTCQHVPLASGWSEFRLDECAKEG